RVRFGRTGVGVPVVAPPRARRQAHEDALRTPFGLDAELRAPVEEQVELDVTATPDLLEKLLAFAVSLVTPALDDGHVRLQKSPAGIAHEEERAFGIVAQIVVEDAADAARLLPVRQEEVRVALLLEPGVVRYAGMPVAHVFPDAVEMADVFEVGVVRRQVGAAAEPLIDRPQQVLTEREVPEIGVDGRDVGRARVD